MGYSPRSHKELDTTERLHFHFHLVRFTSSVVLWGGRNTAKKKISLACVRSACRAWTTLGLLQLMAARAFLIYTAQVSGCSAGSLSKVDAVFCALPRSELLRFRFSGIPQGHRLSCVCVLCPSQVRAAQATSCLVSTLSHVGHAS